MSGIIGGNADENSCDGGGVGGGNTGQDIGAVDVVLMLVRSEMLVVVIMLVRL